MGAFEFFSLKGVQIEPGKMNEISYLPVRNERAQNPNNPCIEEKRSKNLTYPDLDITYNYGMELCIYYHIQQHVAQHCKYDPFVFLISMSVDCSILCNFFVVAAACGLKCRAFKSPTRIYLTVDTYWAASRNL